MPNPPYETLAVLDLGTSKTRILVAEIRDGLLHYAGHGVVPSQGTRKGAVVDLPAASSAIRSAAEAAERASGVPVEQVVMCINGAHVRGVASQAGIPLASRSREVTREDTRTVLELARGISIPDDRELIHVLPQEYVLDHQAGVRDPLGMLASRLEARVYIITAASAPKQNLVLASNHAGLEVLELVFGPFASSEAILRAEERQMGVALIEMGAGGTGVLAFVNGVVAHASFIAVGGDHFTNDIALGFNTPPAEAEKIKRTFADAMASRVSELNSVEVPFFGDRPPQLVSQRKICECIEARARELVRLLQDDLRKAGVLHALGSGLVLAGGGSRLNGFREIIEQQLGLPARIGTTAVIEGAPRELAEPEFAWLMGAACYAHRRLRVLRPRPRRLWERLVAKVTGE